MNFSIVNLRRKYNKLRWDYNITKELDVDHLVDRFYTGKAVFWISGLSSILFIFGFYRIGGILLSLSIAILAWPQYKAGRKTLRTLKHTKRRG